jgi:hypothetical protein
MTKKWMSFLDARKFVQGLGLKKSKEWEEYRKSCNKPDDIPTHPDVTYKNKGWISYRNWIGISETMRSFEDAKKFVQTLNLKSTKKWEIYSGSGKRPRDIPSNPDKVYKNKGWINWKDWLGTRC